jgi:hypothetical protein
MVSFYLDQTDLLVAVEAVQERRGERKACYVVIVTRLDYLYSSVNARNIELLSQAITWLVIVRGE